MYAKQQQLQQQSKHHALIILQVDFIVDALSLVAAEGWQLLPQYIFTRETGEWHHQINLAFCDRKCLAKISYEGGKMTVTDREVEVKTTFELQDAILKAKEHLRSGQREKS